MINNINNSNTVKLKGSQWEGIHVDGLQLKISPLDGWLLNFGLFDGCWLIFGNVVYKTSLTRKILAIIFHNDAFLKNW